MKRIKGIALVFGTLFIVALAIVLYNFTFLKRALTYPSGKDITSSQWYTPKTLVKGNYAKAIPSADSTVISENVLKEISKYCEDRNSSALLLSYKNQIILEQYWQGKDKNSTTNSMSMAKTIIGILVGIAIENGYINSEKEKVSTYISEWADDERDQITIEDLLLMQSGLRNEDNVEEVTSDIIRMYIGTDVVDAALDVPAVKPPNMVYEYNNVNTQILGIILERATEQPIEQYASEQLWKKIGAKDAGWWQDQAGGMPKTFCCFFASPRDWMRVGQLILNEGRWENKQIIPTVWLKKMLTQSQLERDYGYHIWTNYEDGGRRKKHRKSPYLTKVISIDGANKQHVFMIPELDMIAIRVGDKPKEWDEAFIVNRLFEAMP